MSFGHAQRRLEAWKAARVQLTPPAFLRFPGHGRGPWIDHSRVAGRLLFGVSQAYGKEKIMASIPIAAGLPGLSSRHPAVCVVGVLLLLWRSSAPLVYGAAGHEPNAAIASGWWPEMENTWVPIGWKDHPLRFNVLYNGTLIAQPVRYPSRGQGVQLTFQLSRDGEPPASTATRPYQLRSQDGGVGDQGWTDNPAPNLWTRWQQDGTVLRQAVFAHLLGSGLVKTGDEPLFAWVRLSLEKASSDSALVLVGVTAPHLQLEMDRHKNLVVHPSTSAYPRPLRLESEAGKTSHLLLDDAGHVRLAVALPREAGVAFIDQRPARPDACLRLALSAAAGGHADLLVPLVPATREAVDAELALGRDSALREADRFWAAVPETASRVDTPEPLVNNVIRHAPKFAEVIAERHPETGQYSLLSGSWHYEKLWATPTSMNISMILDGLGYHAAAEKYLEIFRQEQGTITPPGKAYHRHAGYFATPRRFTSIDWLSDHGAILYAAAHHALVTDDSRFIDRWTEPIVRACAFIRDFRTSTHHDGVRGILPAAVPTDTGVAEQGVWNDGWNYKGLAAAVRLLHRIHHPRAEEFAREAAEYRETFRRAIRAAAARMPEWVDATGRRERFVPTALPGGGDIQFPFYLDTGPLFLVYSGLLDADDALMRSALRYFRAGPNRANYDLDGAWHQPVSLRHEMSSCEPCYSWNLFHAWQSGDRTAFLEGMYSLFAGSISPRTFIGCEHRGGISGTLFSVPLPIEAARLSVIDDQVEPGRLHLLRLVPDAWLSDARSTVLERVPTEFGPVTLRFRLEDDACRLGVDFRPQFRHPPQAISLHIPGRDKLRSVSVNGVVREVAPGDVVAID